ncbi:hypothetical protein TrLO_g11324 [Triparma laevis f. longispina]|uniref:Thioredoxin domain-containing protein n=1 Tax=Triparma laevis f. longispina TaxID=1714387 RepID=A0A9W7C6N3_9STRA|nr:hypothetical protein TrLO_g11324 [Triparma laevis f. longispina]
MSTYKFSEIFGANLQSKTGTVSTDELLSNKHVMVYFSAHWCPPCRGFTPDLIKFYDGLKAKRDDFELVFVSSDRDESAFNEYFGEMTCHALPYEERESKGSLSKKFKVSGIPTLVVIAPDGTTITTDARSDVSSDPEGAKFPWTPPTFNEIFPSTVVSKDGSVETKDLDDKFLMLYFSAHWCPPCKGFTPQLAQVYKKMKESREDFELVFVSSDRDEASFKEYYGEMPWMALDYEKRDAKEALSKMFDVSGIPFLVVLGKKVDGKRSVISGNARGNATMDQVADFPWYPKPFAELSQTAECNGSDINDSPAIVVLCEAEDDEEQGNIRKAVKAVAEKQPKGTEMLFFYGTQDSGVVPRVRQLCGLTDKKGETVMIKLDIPDNGGYYVSKEVDITEESIEAFMGDAGERQQLG